jgi:hypothetical protein
MDARLLVKYSDGADVADLDNRLARLAQQHPGLRVADRTTMLAADVEQAESPPG